MFCRVLKVVTIASIVLASQCGVDATDINPDRDADLNNYGLSLSSPVTTIAGNGVAGYKDGIAKDAEFLLPTTVAYDAHGRILIVDQSAQRIRMLSDGIVSTIAGSGSVGKLGHVAGGYVDGPALEAKFNEPSGIAVAKDGTIYISDRLNHVIRMLKDGMVTTYAGSTSRRMGIDGKKDAAAFESPRAISLDDDGNLYVADYKFGIRRIDTDGTVTTLPFDSNIKDVVGVSAIGSKSTLRVFASVRYGALGLYHGDTNTTEGWFGGEPDGLLYGYSVAALSSTQALLTDLKTNTIRMITAGDGGIYTGQLSAPSLVGMPYRDGFKDGTYETAKLDDPLGVAVFEGRVAAVADTGNLRIRSFSLPSLRRSYLPGRIEDDGGRTDYRILYLGPSMVKFGVDQEHSIGGRIENVLRRDRDRIGLNKIPDVWTTRIDGLPAASAGTWIEANVPNNAFDLIIVFLEVDTPLGAPGAAANMALAMAATQRSANERHAKLFVDLVPPDNEISPVETPLLNDKFPESAWGDFELLPSAEESIVRELARARIPFVTPYNEIIRYEAHNPLHRHGLAYPYDQHLSPYGDGLYARNIVEGLEAAKPWQTALP